jgi:2-polyprenyl-6-methoxyphenol hydroxylase-like FAD-dependent oxidoreductase
VNDTDVLIVGGGPTGLVLALDLVRRGIRPRVIDRATEFFGGSRADGLLPRTQEVLADLGLIDTVLAEGDAGILVRGYQGDEEIWSGEFAETVPPRPDVPYPNVWFLPQFRTEQLLRDQLAAHDVHVEQGTELLGLTQDTDGVTATMRGGDRIRARYLVGADGGRSTVRNLLGIRFDGETDDATTALFGDVRLTGLDRAHGRVWMSDSGIGVGLMPLAGSDLFTFTGPPPADGEPTLAYLQSVVDEATGRTDIVLREVTWATVWRANARLAERFHDNRVFLAGDAAHVCPPTGGQGMNTGIQDSYNLGWKLAAVLGGAPAELLDSYAAERVPAAKTALALATNLLAKHKRGDDDAHRRGPDLHQLTLNYRTSPLSTELRRAAGPVTAGDRAPDAPCQDTEGRATSLFQLCHGPHWTILTAEDATRYSVGRPDWPATTVVDTDGHIKAAYDIPPDTVVLIRPDGYIGMCAESTADLAPYLRRVTT